MNKKISLSLLSGIFCSLSLIPGCDFLIWLGLVPLLVFNSRDALQSMGLGYSCGTIFLAAISYGLIPDHLAGFLFYTFIASLFVPIFSLILWSVRKPFESFWVIELFAPPIIWVGLEYIFLSGFSIPFNLGLQQYRHPWVIQIANITGIYGVSFLIVLVNSCLALCWRYCWRDKRPFKSKILLSALGLTLLLLVLNGIYGWWMVGREVSQKKTVVKVAGLQGNIPAWQYDLAPIFPEGTRLIRNKYFKMISRASEVDPDIIVLPEGATANYNFRIPRLRDEIYHLSSRTKSWLLFASLDLDEKGKVYNSSFVISPTGKLIGRYDKVKLAPFGEGLICSGNDSCPIQTEFGKLGQMICWESVFPQISRGMTRRGAEILFILTNDGDFRLSILCVLHAAEAIFRAVENGRWVVRVANSGLSMVINPKGEILTKVSLCTEGIIHAKVGRCQKTTIYAKIGDMFSWLCLLLTIFTVGAALAKKDHHQVKTHRGMKQKPKIGKAGYVSQLKQPCKIGIIILSHCLTMTGIILFSILAIGYTFQPDRTLKKHLIEFFSLPKLPIEEVRKNFLQAGSNTCGPAALAHLLNLWGLETSEQDIQNLVRIEKKGTSMYNLVQAAKKLGFNAWGERQNLAALKETILPVIAFINSNHWVVVLEIKDGFVVLFDPAMGYVKIRDDLFNLAWNGYVMLVRTKPISKSLEGSL